MSTPTCITREVEGEQGFRSERLKEVGDDVGLLEVCLDGLDAEGALLSDGERNESNGSNE